MSAPYGPQPPAYQRFAYYPMAPVSTPGPMPCPRQVKAAFWLTLAGSVLFIAAVAVILAASMGDIRDSIRMTLIEEGFPFTEDDVRSEANATVFVLMLLAVLTTTPFVTFAALLRTAYNWMRVLLTVFVSIGCFVSLFQILMPYPNTGGVFRMLMLAEVGISVAIVVLVFGSAANRYFVR